MFASIIQFAKVRILWPCERWWRLFQLVPFPIWRQWASLRRTKSGLCRFRLQGLPHSIALRTGTSDFEVFREVFLQEEYRYKPDFQVRTIIDCGTNIGLTALYFLRRFPKARIVCLEPDPQNFELAQMNLAPYSDRVTLLPAAVWSSTETLAIRKGLRDGEHWSTQVSRTAQPGDPTCESVTIQKLQADFEMPTIDVLKIDIEGAEKDLFEGDISFLGSTRCLMIEVHEKAIPGCTALIERSVCDRGFARVRAPLYVAVNHSAKFDSDNRRSR